MLPLSSRISFFFCYKCAVWFLFSISKTAAEKPVHGALLYVKQVYGWEFIEFLCEIYLLHGIGYFICIYINCLSVCHACFCCTKHTGICLVLNSHAVDIEIFYMAMTIIILINDLVSTVDFPKVVKWM